MTLLDLQGLEVPGGHSGGRSATSKGCNVSSSYSLLLCVI